MKKIRIEPGINLQITNEYLLSFFFSVKAETNSLHGNWLTDSIHFVCQPFSGFSFEAHASIFSLMLCANRLYTANSLTYPFRRRATGLLGLMDITDHTRPRWKDKRHTGESSRGGRLGEKPFQCCISSCSHFENYLIWKSWSTVLSTSLIYDWVSPCRVAEPTVGHPLTPDRWP